MPSEVVVGTEAGLKQPSAINLHHLVTVPKSELKRFVGTVSEETLLRVKEAMLAHTFPLLKEERSTKKMIEAKKELAYLLQKHFTKD